MTEQSPYDIGFLENLKAINFGGLWMAWGVLSHVGVGASITLQFPNGSFDLVSGDAFPNTIVQPIDPLGFPLQGSGSTIGIGAPDLTGKLPGKIIGFSRQGVQFGLLAGWCFMELGTGGLPGSKAFSVKATLGENTNQAFLYAAFLQKGILKTGNFPYTGFNNPGGGNALQLVYSFLTHPPNPSADTSGIITVDPKALTVSGAG